MVCIVIYIDKFLLSDMIVKPATHTRKCLEAIAKLMLIEATRKGNSRSNYSILYIEQCCAFKLQVIEHAVGCTHVEEQVTIVRTNIDSIIIGINTMGGICRNIGISKFPYLFVTVAFLMVVMFMTIFHIFFTIESAKDSFFQEKAPLDICLVGKLDISIHHCFMGTIDI